MTRPLRVTVVAWFFMFWALLTVIPKVFLLINPEAYRMALELNVALQASALLPVPIWFQLLHAFVGVVVILVCGIFMLKGRLWALVVFLIWIVGVLGLTLAVSGLSVALYMKTAVAAAVAILLLTPKSLAYFSDEHRGDNAQTQTGCPGVAASGKKGRNLRP